MLSEEGLRERRWGHLPGLRKVLEGQHLPQHYYGWTSVSDNIFEQIPRELEIALLVGDFRDSILQLAKDVESRRLLREDIEYLAGNLETSAKLLIELRNRLRELNDALRDHADHR